MPCLERERRRLSATLFRRPVIASARRVLIFAVRRSVSDIDVSTVRQPSRLARCKVLVRIRDTRVILVLVLVVVRIRIRVPAQPELLDERIPLFIVGQVLERLGLLVGNDPPDVLIQPLLVLALQLGLHGVAARPLFVVAQPALQWIWLLRNRGRLRHAAIVLHRGIRRRTGRCRLTERCRTRAREHQNSYTGNDEARLRGFHEGPYSCCLLLLPYCCFLDPLILSSHAPPAQGLAATRCYHQDIKSASGNWCALFWRSDLPDFTSARNRTPEPCVYL